MPEYEEDSSGQCTAGAGKSEEVEMDETMRQRAVGPLARMLIGKIKE
ncbi:MAG: hypothetical protein ACLR3S_07220 [Clostridium fessum]